MTSYRIEILVSDNKFDLVYTGDSKTSCELLGLTPFSSLQYRAQALNCHGGGDYSDVIVVQTAPGVPAPPGRPTIVQTTGTSITVAWTAPVTQGSCITGYMVDLDGASSKLLPLDVYQYTFNNLGPSKEYKIRVQAASKAGNSALSAVVVVRTKMAVPGVPILEVASVTHNSAKLRWVYPTKRWVRGDERNGRKEMGGGGEGYPGYEGGKCVKGMRVLPFR